MNEPDGLIERLRDERATPLDLEFVDYKLGVTVNRTEIKILQNLRSRIVASIAGNGEA